MVKAGRQIKQGASLAGLNEHEVRYALTNELHARPVMAVQTPAQSVHLALMAQEGSAPADRAHLVALCARYGVHPPAPDANHFVGDFGAFRLKWERHTEFVTYSFIKEGSFDSPFEMDLPALVPLEWVEAIPGQLMVATQVSILDKTSKTPEPDQIGRWLTLDSTVSSLVSDSTAQIWSDLRIHPTGYNRILVKDYELHPRRAGRLLQRLLEIATYRNMALLALPVARETSPRIARIDRALADLTGDMGRTDESRASDAVLLADLTKLSAEVEALSAATAYRFSAGRAYHALVQERLRELRETRIADYQSLGEFLDRRMAPAMRTCDSVWDRLEKLAKRASRVANLLRTRVDYALEEQNQRLLASMDRRAHTQLRLQETVEGLSIAAISYYAVGLISFVAKAAEAGGVAINADLVTGASIPIVVALLWLAVRRVRKAITGADPAE